MTAIANNSEPTPTGEQFLIGGIVAIDKGAANQPIIASPLQFRKQGKGFCAYLHGELVAWAHHGHQSAATAGHKSCFFVDVAYVDSPTTRSHLLDQMTFEREVDTHGTKGAPAGVYEELEAEAQSWLAKKFGGES